MRLQNSNNPSWQTLKRTQNVLNASAEQMAEMLELTHREYVSLWLQNRSVPIQSALSFARRYNMTLESFYSGDVDYTTLARHHSGDFTYIPEKYTIGAFSKKRTVANFLNYAKAVRGDDFRAGLLRSFQLNESALDDLDSPVNIQLVADVARRMREAGFKEVDFFRVGVNTYFAHKNGPLGKALAQFDSGLALFKEMEERYYVHFDKNADYRITQLDNQGCIVEAYVKEELSDLLGTKTPGNADCCTQRRGAMSVLSAFGKLKPSFVAEPRCIHKGDPMCRYEIRFEEGCGVL